MPQGQRGFELIIEVMLPVRVTKYRGVENIKSSNSIVDLNGEDTISNNTYEETVNKLQYLHLDVISERTVTSDATLPGQPIYDGSTLVDHMYVNPDKYTVSGIFSMYGNYYNEDYAYVPGTVKNGDRLSNIQKTFEYIKQNGILCNLSTYIAGSKGSPRFKNRNRMAIESITWNESESSMKYSITFKEIKEVIFDSTVINVDPTYNGLNIPKAESLGDIMFKEITTNTNSTTLTLWDRILLGCLVSSRIYITKVTAVLARRHTNIANQKYRDIINEIKNYAPDFLPEIVKNAEKNMNSEYFKDAGAGALIGAKEGAKVGVAIGGIYTIASAASSTSIAGASATAATASSAGPVGIIIGVCVLVGAAVVSTISYSVSKNKQWKKRFKLLDGILFDSDAYDEALSRNPELSISVDTMLKQNPTTTPNYEEFKRLRNFLNSANTILNQLSNNARFYTISTDYENNKNSECTLTISGMIYKISFINKEEKIYKVIDKNNNISFVKENNWDGSSIIRVFRINKVQANVKVYNNFSEWEVLDGLNGVPGNLNESTVTCESLDEMDSSHAIFRDASQLYYVYLYNSWYEPNTANILVNYTNNNINDHTTWIEKMLEYKEQHSGIANCYLVESYGTVVAVKDKLKSKIEDILTSAEV